MGCFKPYCHFKLSPAELLELVAAFRAQSRMIFDNDCVKLSDACSDCGQVTNRHSRGIEEIAAVIEFEMRGVRQSLECEVDLLRDQAWRDGFCQCVLPEITHQTVERAFTIGQENSGDGLDSSVPRKFLFTEPVPGFAWIWQVSRTAKTDNLSGE